LPRSSIAWHSSQRLSPARLWMEGMHERVAGTSPPAKPGKDRGLGLGWRQSSARTRPYLHSVASLAAFQQATSPMGLCTAFLPRATAHCAILLLNSQQHPTTGQPRTSQLPLLHHPLTESSSSMLSQHLPEASALGTPPLTLAVRQRREARGERAEMRRSPSAFVTCAGHL
jgi:hypothetical protein